MNDKKMTLGFNTRGTEEYFETMLRKAIEERTTTGFRYVEIGIAEGTTLASVATVLRDTLNSEWQAVGIDLFDGPFFNERNFLKKTLAFDTVIVYPGSGTINPVVPSVFGYDIVVTLLKGDTQRAVPDRGTINFALIDGCHGAPCVEKDFLSIEAGIAQGGIVAFHDAGVEDQGIHHQKHCDMPISVQRALGNLGLWWHSTKDIEPPMRPGWRFIGSINGDKSPGNLVENGHGFVFFQKINA
jgi:hypothetical protein